MNVRYALMVLALAVSAACARGQVAPPNLVQAQLLADVQAIEPGKPFTVGVHFRIRPGWHIYWQNPGDSGAPTSVKLSSPDGFAVSELRWPMPEKFMQPGEIVGYGYKDAVLLSVVVTPPEDLPAGTEIEISADASWLCCEQVCVPGRAKLRLSLPVREQAVPSNRELFQRWAQRLPMPPGSAPVRITFDGGLDPDSQRGQLRIHLKWMGEPGREVAFYPIPEAALRVEEIKVLRAGGAGSTVAFDASVLKGRKLESEQLAGLIVWTDASGEKRAVEVAVPLAAGAG